MTGTIALKKANVMTELSLFRQFVPHQQLLGVLTDEGEESGFAETKLLELANLVRAMPKTYEQDGLGREAVAYLHYFGGSADFYITEKDMETEQLQAFGAASYGGALGLELGYISLADICANPFMELDFYYKPQTLREIYAEREAQDL